MELYKLIPDAYTILSQAYAKIGELGVSAVDSADSPKQPRVEDQLIEVNSLFYIASNLIVLSSDGTQIVGINTDADTVNGVLTLLKDAAGIYPKTLFPAPLTNLDFSGNNADSFPVGALGSILVSDGTKYISLAKGADGTSLTASPTGLVWSSVVGNGIPSGGSAGEYLRKSSNTSYVTYWDTLTLADVSDVTATAANINILASTNVTSTEFGYVHLVTGPIQNQIDNKLGLGLANGKFYVGNASNLASPVLPTGDVTFNNAGLFTIGSNTITNAQINTAAAISRFKIAAGTANTLVVNDASGIMTDAAAIAANRVLVSSNNGIPVASSVDTTTFAFFDPTSSIQNQINSKLSATITTPAQGDLLQYNGTAWINLHVGTSGQVITSNGTSAVWGNAAANGLPSGGTANQFLTKIDSTNYNTQWHSFVLADVTDVSATNTELNLLSGLTTGATQLNYSANVTSDIQTQLGLKLNTTLPHNAIFVGNISDTAGVLSPGLNNQVLQIIAGVPSWQTFTPGTGSVTSVDVSGGSTGLTTSGGPVSTTGVITINGTLNVAHGGTGLAATTPYAVITGGTTSTGALQQVSGLGTSGYVLTSNGAGALPTWQIGTGGTGPGGVVNELQKNNGSSAFTGTGVFSSTTYSLTLGDSANVTTPYLLVDGNSADRGLDIRLKGTGQLGVGDATVANSSVTIIARSSSTNADLKAYAKAARVRLGIGGSDDIYVDATSGGVTQIVRSGAGGSFLIKSNALTVMNGDTGDIIINTTTPIGTGKYGNLSIFSESPFFGSGQQVTYFSNSIANPSTSVTGGGVMYIKATDSLPYWWTGTTSYPMTGSGGGGSGTVTSVSVVTANGVSGSVATSTTTPAITLTLGAITPSSVNTVVFSGSSTPSLAVSGTSSISGTNTGDQTSVSGNAGTATALATGRTIALTGDVTYTSPAFDGTGNVTAAASVVKILGNTIPANASGVLTNNGSGTLTWSPAGGAGTVTSVNSADANATITNPTTTPVITIVAAPKLATARTINGTSFDGTGNITITADASTLTGSSLNTTVLASSLTSVGTLTGGSTGAGFTIALASSTITGRLPFANLTQIAGLSLLGVTGSGTADVAAITGVADQILRVNGAGTTLGFGSIDLSKPAVVGTSILPVANGGTGSATNTSWLLASGGTLTGVNTITSNSPSQLVWTGTLTATANNQFFSNYTPNITSRSTASDTVIAQSHDININANSTSIDAVGSFLKASFNALGAVATFSQALNSCVGMTPGTYTSVAPASTIGSGTGALFTVVVASATTFTSVTVTNGGSGYNVGDIIIFNASQFGGSSGVLQETVNTITGKSIAATSSVLRIQNATKVINTNYYKFIDFITSTGGSLGSIGSAVSAGNNNIAYYDRSGQMFTSDGTTFTLNRTLSLSGALSLSTLNVSGVTTSTVVLNNTNPLAFKTTTTAFPTSGTVKMSGYSATNAIAAGLLSTAGLGTITGGSGYTNGSYNNVAFTGGSGTGGFAGTITVSGGAVTAVTVNTGFGTGYAAGDVLSVAAAGIGGTGSGFSIVVNSVDFSNVILSGYSWAPSLTDASSANKYVGFYGAPTVNQTANATGLVAAVYWDPTLTNIVSGNYGIIIVPTSTKSGFGVSTPTAKVHIGPGSATAGTGPLKLTAGTNLTTTEAGLFEFNGTHLYFTIANAGTRYQIDQQVSPIPYVDVTGTTQAVAVNTKYKANNNSTRVVFTLPTTAAVGEQVLIRGYGTAGWQLAQNASQVVHGSSDTTTGTGGYIQSQARYDCVTLECIVANNEFIIINTRGTLTIN